MAIWTGKCRFGSWNYMKQIFFIFLQNLRKDKEEKEKNISKSWCYGWHPACNIILVIPEKGEREWKLRSYLRLRQLGYLFPFFLRY